MQTRLEKPNERHNYQSLEFPFSVFPHADLSGSIPGCVLRGGAFATASLPSPPPPPPPVPPPPPPFSPFSPLLPPPSPHLFVDKAAHRSLYVLLGEVLVTR